MDAVAVVFAYDDLDTETRIVVQQKTGEIRERAEAIRRNTIEIGQRLIEIKERLPHGAWGMWLVAEFGWSQDTAGNLMNVARMAEQNPKFSEFEDRFARTALAVLAAPSAPDEARSEALERAEAGEVITHQVAQQIISQHRPEQSDVRRGADGRAIDTAKIGRPEPSHVQQAVRERLQNDDSTAFNDLRRHAAALGWELRRFGLYYKLIRPDGILHLSTTELVLIERTIEAIESGASFNVSADPVVVGQRTNPHQPDPKEPPAPTVEPATPELRVAVEREAHALGMLVEPDGDRVRLRWPEEDAAQLDALPWAWTLDWLRYDGQRIAAERAQGDGEHDLAALLPPLSAPDPLSPEAAAARLRLRGFSAHEQIAGGKWVVQQDGSDRRLLLSAADLALAARLAQSSAGLTIDELLAQLETVTQKPSTPAPDIRMCEQCGAHEAVGYENVGGVKTWICPDCHRENVAAQRIDDPRHPALPRSFVADARQKLARYDAHALVSQADYVAALDYAEARDQATDQALVELAAAERELTLLAAELDDARYEALSQRIGAARRALVSEAVKR